MLRAPELRTGWSPRLQAATRRGVIVFTLSAGTWLVTVRAHAQVNTQLWGNVTLNWVESPRVTYELDFEPKILLSKPEGDPRWANIDVSPNAEYAWKPWLDLIGEATTGVTRQTDDVNTFELSPRVGARFHLFARDMINIGPRREQVPRRRVLVRDLVRVEWRNLFHSGGVQDESSVRFRNRLELLIPLNRARVTDDDVRYLLADWEWFVPTATLEERFANRQRIRTGIGYRRNFHWRFEVIYAWTRSRETIEDDFATSDNIFNIRVKRVF
jgi:hypothetical protein